MYRVKKIEESILECYSILYENSEPSANFQKLVDEAPVDENGQKVIDYNSYEIEEERFMKIIDEVTKKYKLSKYEKVIVKNSVMLGCSPKFKIN